MAVRAPANGTDMLVALGAGVTERVDEALVEHLLLLHGLHKIEVQHLRVAASAVRSLGQHRYGQCPTLLSLRSSGNSSFAESACGKLRGVGAQAVATARQPRG